MRVIRQIQALLDELYCYCFVLLNCIATDFVKTVKVAGDLEGCLQHTDVYTQ